MTWFEYDDKYYTYKTADVKDGKVTILALLQTTWQMLNDM